MTPYITPQELTALSDSKQECALLDVREEGAFSEARLLFASCLSISRLELRIHRLVPNTHATLILMDGRGEGLAETARYKLLAFGYLDVRVLKGGVTAWAEAGYSIYSGVNVLSKAFGEFVYHHNKTPDIEPETLKSWMDAGRKLAIMDARPFSEYHNHTIPTSVSVPGAELVYRAQELVTDSDTTIIVNCAGRTRSIIGCQSLINAGIANEVVCLRNGTMGWKLAGYTVETGQVRCVDTISHENRERARRKAQDVANKFDIALIGRDDLGAIKRDETHTVYCLDVRTPHEFARGHMPGTKNAPGGQLVQATDEYIAVRNASIVLVDPELTRAIMTASWLIQMGYRRVFVLRDVSDCDLCAEVQLDTSHIIGKDITISAETLASKIKRGDTTLILDVATSVEHKSAHIPGATWALRGRYEDIERALSAHEDVVITGNDPELIAYTAKDLAKITTAPIHILNGGNTAWREAGHAMASGFGTRFSVCDDVWYKPYEYDDPDKERAAANKYLTWEVNLVEKIENDGVKFHIG